MTACVYITCTERFSRQNGISYYVLAVTLEMPSSVLIPISIVQFIGNLERRTCSNLETTALLSSSNWYANGLICGMHACSNDSRSMALCRGFCQKGYDCVSVSATVSFTATARVAATVNATVSIMATIGVWRR